MSQTKAQALDDEARRRRRRIRDEVAKQYKNPTAVRHETLLDPIRAEYGEAAAWLWDEEESLPLMRSRHRMVSWPVTEAEEEGARGLMFGAAGLGLFVAVALLGAIASWTSATPAVWWLLVAAGGTWAGLAVARYGLPRLIKSTDVEERERILAVYESLRASERDKAERAAAEARALRLGRKRND
ncbi:MAG: hypothetical protein LBE25_09340 [Arthrobacter sp.]|jgi:hypothetical protein|nr:hypothetical protein [Arthrobacter sp.]